MSGYVLSLRVRVRADALGLRGQAAAVTSLCAGGLRSAAAAAAPRVERRAGVAAGGADESEAEGASSDGSRDCESGGGGGGGGAAPPPQDSEEAAFASAATERPRTITAIMAKYERGGAGGRLGADGDAASEALSGTDDDESSAAAGRAVQNEWDYDLDASSFFLHCASAARSRASLHHAFRPSPSHIVARAGPVRGRL
jgi:hypothetical protein